MTRYALWPKNSMTNTHLPKNAFTLIELLIVIAIIGVMAGILAMVINPEQFLKPSRDSVRIKNILELQTAITGALTKNQIRLIDTSTCADCNSIDGSGAIDGTGWIRFDNVSGDGLKKYMQNLPKDPKNEGALRYEFYSDGESFELNAIMESGKYTINAQDDGGNDTNVYERGWDLELN